MYSSFIPQKCVISMQYNYVTSVKGVFHSSTFVILNSKNLMFIQDTELEILP